MAKYYSVLVKAKLFTHSLVACALDCLVQGDRILAARPFRPEHLLIAKHLRVYVALFACALYV